MSVFVRILVIAVVLAAVFGAGFALWGERFDAVFSQERCVEWFSKARPVAWLIAIGLLVADLVLPVPATGVMAALGAVYGVPVGAAVGALGSALSALVGYSLARLVGKRGTRWIAGDEEVERFRSLFERWGGAGVVASRPLPILPEVMSILAGLARMSFGRFVAALLLGTIPTAVLFAWIGAASAREPWWGILAAVLIPLGLWPVFLRVTRRR